MDYQIAHTLDRFSAHHDGFEDPLRAYVGASEALFAGVVIALLLLVPGVRRSLARRAAVAAFAAAGVALLIAPFVSSGVDRPRPLIGRARSWRMPPPSPRFPHPPPIPRSRVTMRRRPSRSRRRLPCAYA